MILLIDNYDSFTYNLYQCFLMLGEEIEVRRNDALDAEVVARLKPEILVISPGPGRPSAAGNCLRIIEAFHRELPMIGICLGMQIIARSFGGKVVEAREPVHGKVKQVWHGEAGLFAGLPNPVRVTRYHSLVVERASLPSCLEVLAESEEREIMALRHRSYRLSGVQFHPEAVLTEGGLPLLANALQEARS